MFYACHHLHRESNVLYYVHMRKYPITELINYGEHAWGVEVEEVCVDCPSFLLYAMCLPFIPTGGLHWEYQYFPWCHRIPIAPLVGWGIWGRV